jgi:uncharacterized membrane protein
MGFDVCMGFLVLAFLPVAMLVSGWLLKYHPAKTPNNAYGYRTRASGRTQETWDFAQAYSGSWWLRWGKITLVLTALVWALAVALGQGYGGWVFWTLLGVQFVVFLWVIPATERALKKNFDEFGYPRSWTEK